MPEDHKEVEAYVAALEEEIKHLQETNHRIGAVLQQEVKAHREGTKAHHEAAREYLAAISRFEEITKWHARFLGVELGIVAALLLAIAMGWI